MPDVDIKLAGFAEAAEPDKMLQNIARNALRSAAAAGPQAQIEWDYATSIRRDHPLIAALLGALGKSEDEVDGLFVAAAGL